MRWQLVAQVARGTGFSSLLSQIAHLTNQHVQVRLLADYDLVKLLQRVFQEAGLDFEFSNAGVGGVGGVHGGIGHHPATGVLNLRARLLVDVNHAVSHSQ